MAKKYLDYDGLLYLWGKLKAYFAPLASPALTGTPTAPTATTGTSNTQIATTAFVANTVGAMTSGVSDVKIGNTSIVTGGVATIPESSSSSAGLISSADKTKLDTVMNGAEPNQSAFSTVRVAVGTSWTDLEADSKMDTLRIIQGTNITLTAASQSDNLTISATDTTYSDATTSTPGLMSTADKAKLDSITMTNGVIDSSVLPSFVDNVIEAYARSNQTELGSTWLATGSASGTVITPETGKIYVLMNDSTSYSANSQFRWGGTAYVKLNDGGVSEITNGEIDTIVAS